jgi:hypothetical protein
MLAAVQLLLALLTGAEDLGPQPAEAAVSYQCRTEIQPKARRCAQACEALHVDAEARWGCVSDCTTHALDALAECRKAPAAIATTEVAAPVSTSSSTLARR